MIGPSLTRWWRVLYQHSPIEGRGKVNRLHRAVGWAGLGCSRPRSPLIRSVRAPNHPSQTPRNILRRLFDVFPTSFLTSNGSISAKSKGSSRECRSHVTKRLVEGLGKLASGFKESMRRSGTVDLKGIGKPDALKGSHDEVQKVWKSWSYKFETWFCSQWSRGQEA